MKRLHFALSSKPALAIAISFASLYAVGHLFAETPVLTADKPIVIPDSHGKFDFIEVDQQAGRLLAAHTGNATLDIFDSATGKFIKSVQTGVDQDAAVDSKGGKYHVAVSAGKKLVTVDSTTFEVTGETPLTGPADILAFDPKNNTAYIGHDDSTEVWAVDVIAKKIVATITIPEGPEGIIYDEVSDRVYANSKIGDAVVVIDPATNKPVATWPTAPAQKPHGSALDAEGHRLFVVGANGKLVAIDLKSGKVTGSVDIAPRVDEIAFDPGLKRVYCASGAGVLSVVDAKDESLKSLGDVPTHEGTHSVAVDAKTHAVWIAFAEGNQSFIQRLK